MERPSQVSEMERSDLPLTLDLLAERAPSIDAAKLVDLWPAVEERVLAVVGEGPEATTASAGGTPLLLSDEERIRNLAWEVGVSVDLHAVHVGAIRALAALLRERDQRSAKRVARSPRARSRASRPDSNFG